MTVKQLGQLERVEVRDIWDSEASDFTPWLASNLSALADTLGLELELEAQERPVGPFRADILCKDIGTDRWVLIENQLERTDHTHLGQLLTYASGLDAVTIIWIAARFTEEHRSTLDWLNRITDASFRFFGLEVELWRIGDSLAAPKFNVVSKPNDWSQSVANAARIIDEEELSETRIMQLAYWGGLNEALRQAGGPVLGNRKPQPQHWMAYPIGRSKFHLAAVMMRPKRKLRAELCISGDEAKTFLRLLERQRHAIENELGYSLNWEEPETRRDTRVAVYLDGFNLEDEADWARQHQWLAERLNDLHRVFAPRVRSLNTEDS
jgi:hypothetical protein